MSTTTGPNDQTTLGDQAALSDQADRDRIKIELDLNLFVDAGAGSGKTKAMVDRVCALIDRGTDVATIVAITFTEKAAAELRQRIRTELSVGLSSGLGSALGAGLSSHNPEAAAHRSRALDRLDSAPMGTIHSFAGRLLRENPIEAGVPPLLTITDELGSRIAFTARWEKARDFLFASPAARSALDTLLALGVTLTHLEKVAQAFDYSWDRLELGSGSGSAADKGTGGSTAQPTPLEAPAEIVRRVRGVTALRSLCAKPEGDVGCRDLLLLEEWSAEYLALETRVAGNELPASALFTNLYPLLLGRNIPKPVAAGNWKGEKATVDAALTELRDYITGIVSRHVRSALELVIAVLTSTIREAAVERQESGNLEFHDLLVHSRALVASDERTWRRISERYPIIMLDEFQDTDPLQAELAVRLAAQSFLPAGGDWHTAPLRPGALFTVGDPKQSIYRFRRADIATFLAMGDRLDGRVVLSTNFRSSEPVLRWVNEVFGDLIQADGNRQPSFQPLDTRPQRPAWNAENGPAITVIGQDSLAEKAGEAQRAEAKDVAYLIREAVGLPSGVASGLPNGAPNGQQSDQSNASASEHADTAPAWRHDVFDKVTQQWSTRALTLSDICILIPSRTSLFALQNALDDADIEYVAEASSLVYSSEEIRDLLLTAKAIANTADEATLVTALRTSVFGCGDDELLLWASGVASDAGAPLANPWNLFGTELTADSPSRVGRSLAFLKQLVGELPTLTPAEVLERMGLPRLRLTPSL